MLEAMTRSWGALAFRGAVAIAFGIVAFVWPGPTIQVLVFLLAAFALVEGAVNIIGGLRVRQGWALAEGIVSVLIGIVILIAGPGLTAIALLYLVAAWAILTGIARIVAAIQLRRVLSNEWLLIASGAASLIFGVIAAIVFQVMRSGRRAATAAGPAWAELDPSRDPAVPAAAVAPMPVQMSPDGAFWWDGQKWRAAS